MQNHHLTSISTSPQKTAQQFFLTQIPIWQNHHLTSISTSPQKTAQQFFLTQIPIWQNHHLTSISTSPQKTAQQFFLTQIPIWIITSMMLTAVQLYFFLGMATGAVLMLLLILMSWLASRF